MGMDDLEINLAQPHEMEEVLALVEELLAELGEEGDEYARIERQQLQAALEREQKRTAPERSGQAKENDRFFALLARDRQGTLLGVVTLSTAFAFYAGGEYGVIEEMYVRPSYRGHGIGTRMLEHALAIAQERRWFRLEVTGPAAALTTPLVCDLGAGGGKNAADAARAVRFYENFGFEYVGPKMRLLVEGRRTSPASSSSHLANGAYRKGGWAS